MNNVKTRIVELVVIIVILKFLIPEIYSGAENTLLMFFQTVQEVLATSKTSMTAGFVAPSIKF